MIASAVFGYVSDREKKRIPGVPIEHFVLARAFQHLDKLDRSLMRCFKLIGILVLRFLHAHKCLLWKDKCQSV